MERSVRCRLCCLALLASSALVMMSAGCNSAEAEAQRTAIAETVSNAKGAIADRDWNAFQATCDTEALSVRFSEDAVSWAAARQGKPPVDSADSSPPLQRYSESETLAYQEWFMTQLREAVTSGPSDAGVIGLISEGAVADIDLHGQEATVVLENEDWTPSHLEVRMVELSEGWLIVEILNPEDVLGWGHVFQ